jgi:translocation and assembly module TamB
VDIRLANPLAPSVVEIAVTEIGGKGNKEPIPDRRPPGNGWSSDLDLTIKMPGAVFIRGRGIDSEWSGDVVATGSWAKPELRGDLNLVRGEISFAGQVFVLSAGTIVFEPGREISPLIDLSASHEGKDITALMKVTGSPAAPVIDLTSRPELPEEEVLARVMFGKSVSRLSSAQGVRLATVIRALSRGETISEDEFGVGRTLLGIDVLAEERKRREGGEGDWRLDRDRRKDEPSGPKPVEIEISPGISVAAEQEEDESVKEGTLGIIWKWDY